MSMNSFHARASNPRPKSPRPKERSAHAGVRADQLLVERGLCPSRAVARRLIEAGHVTTTDGPVVRPAQFLPADADLRVAEDDELRYVSRGGLKLAGALRHTGLRVEGRRCLDLGQSTGGFTDCLLQAGAARVVGVDVGHGQLHHRLAGDPRVAGIEGLNARDLLPEHLPLPTYDLVVGDLSFISLTLVLPRLRPLLAAGGDLLLLVKPQFEVGPDKVGKGGIVRDAGHFPEVERKLRAAAAACALAVRDYFPSCIAGGDGNREFFIWMTP
ncbi:MAG TPA: TlyA family RNA methyltransferase [Rhodocyclaceae bacterium]|nr:TlyA family RNA methyltransferase [Rhodocyclaceae bacterium]